MWLKPTIFQLLVSSIISVVLGRGTTPRSGGNVHLTARKLEAIPDNHYGTNGYVIDLRPHTAVPVITAVRISMPNLTRHTEVICNILYQIIGEEQKSVEVPLNKHVIPTTAEIDLPGEYDELNPPECNVSITAKYPIGKHKVHTASMDIGPINLTRCDTVCYENLDNVNSTKLMELTIVEKLDGFVNIEAAMPEKIKYCYNSELDYAFVEYGTNKGQRGYILFKDTTLEQFTLIDIKERSSLRLRVRYACEAYGSYDIRGEIDTTPISEYGISTDCFEFTYEHWSGLQVGYITMPSLNKYRNVTYIITCSTPKSGSRSECPLTLDRTDETTPVYLRLGKGSNFLNVTPSYRIGMKMFQMQTFVGPWMNLSRCDSRCMDELEGNASDLHLERIKVEGQRSYINVTIDRCVNTPKNVEASYGVIEGQRGYLSILNMMENSFIFPSIHTFRRLHVRVDIYCPQSNLSYTFKNKLQFDKRAGNLLRRKHRLNKSHRRFRKHSISSRRRVPHRNGRTIRYGFRILN
ncbi:uncharacterized protein LOC111261753 isoform X2 [Varroa jacobsoni]|uniref:uncharacterized protein LOC111261753 isoform X2 n=1 Tax=Varroa jacobsoni TaxID=62625 RepID=UPI000BF8C0BC|nr:uncharacterized protein LOC111261753 isoform X2 [Varroa jacobsoni]